MKRICIYLTYDKQKIIDQYIGYMLKELRSCVDYLVVVCNNKEIIFGSDILEENADQIFYRENIGFDAGGFKDALCYFLGWEKVRQYEELVLVNDSMFGPFRAMQDIFSEMDRKTADFWGLARHGENRTSSLGHVYEHIQSFFIVIRTKMLHSKQFEEFWSQLPYFTVFSDVIKHYEIAFTKFFSDLGYSYIALADTAVNDSDNGLYNYPQYRYIPFEMIKKRNFPFLKKRPLTGITHHAQTQENFRRAIDYIDWETNYDVNLIWDNIIRCSNIADLQRIFHLQYIISSDRRQGVLSKVIIVVSVSHKESAEYVLEYIQEIGQNEVFLITAQSEEYLEVYKNLGLKCIVLEAREFSGLLDMLSGYDFVCILHDMDLTSDDRPGYVGKSYFFTVWENLLKDKEYILGILDCFSKESRLGLLMPPQPNFGDYFGEYGRGWNGKLETVMKVIKKLNLNCQVSELSPPFRITDNVWIRGCILKKIATMDKADFETLPYIWGYLAQDLKYYSGIVESAEYASINEVNLQFYLQDATYQIRKYGNDFSNFKEMKNNTRIEALQAFCIKYPKVFVYGAGDMANRYSAFIPNIEAYVVSDGKEKADKLYGISIKFLSEIQVPDNWGMVVCVDDKNQLQVMPMLKKYGIKNCFYI